jgi:hypothetical protein
MTTDTAALITERTSTHGPLEPQAAFFEAVMAAWRATPNWDTMSPEMRLCIQYNVQKQARIGCGDPWFLDHWKDQDGYNGLVIDRIAARNNKPVVVDTDDMERKMRAVPGRPVEVFRPGTPEDGGHHARMRD